MRNKCGELLDCTWQVKPLPLASLFLTWVQTRLPPVKRKEHLATQRTVDTSGRYRDDRLTRHFTPNSTGVCLVCVADGVPDPSMGDLAHILLHCPSLSSRRSLLGKYWQERTTKSVVCRELVDSFESKSESYKMQFLLDCSTIPDILQATRVHGSEVQTLLFRMTRTFCYSLHRERLRKLDRWS